MPGTLLCQATGYAVFQKRARDTKGGGGSHPSLDDGGDMYMAVDAVPVMRPYRQCPSRQYQPRRSCAQCPGLHLALARGGIVQRPGTRTYLAPFHRWNPTTQTYPGLGGAMRASRMGRGGPTRTYSRDGAAVAHPANNEPRTTSAAVVTRRRFNELISDSSGSLGAGIPVRLASLAEV
jgi:hypothetical protein